MKINCEWLRHTKHHIFITANSFPSKERKEMNQNTAKRGSLKYKQLEPLMRTSRRWLLSDSGWVAGLEPGPQLLTSRAARLPASLSSLQWLSLWQGKTGKQGGLKWEPDPFNPTIGSLPLAVFFSVCVYSWEKKGACSKNRLGIACQWVLKTHFFRSL